MAPQNPDLHTTAVIVTYQSRETIGAALAVAERAFAAGRLRVIVVDNGSTDGTVEWIRREHPWVELIVSSANLGFGRGCNLGFERVDTRYVLFLNPDATLDLEGQLALEAVLQARPEVGIVGPAIRYEGDVYQQSNLLTTPTSVVRAALHLAPFPQAWSARPGDAPRPASCICGAIMLVRSDLFRALGGFDDRYFLYFEETDLCLRARSAGAGVYVTGRAVGGHVGGASAARSGGELLSGNIAGHYYPSRFYFMVKHYGWSRAVVAECVELAVMTAASLLKRVTGARGAERLAARLRAGFLRAPQARPRAGDEAGRGLREG